MCYTNKIKHRLKKGLEDNDACLDFYTVYKSHKPYYHTICDRITRKMRSARKKAMIRSIVHYLVGKQANDLQDMVLPKLEKLDKGDMYIALGMVLDRAGSRELTEIDHYLAQDPQAATNLLKDNMKKNIIIGFLL